MLEDAGAGTRLLSFNTRRPRQGSRERLVGMALPRLDFWTVAGAQELLRRHRHRMCDVHTGFPLVAVLLLAMPGPLERC